MKQNIETDNRDRIYMAKWQGRINMNHHKIKTRLWTKSLYLKEHRYNRDWDNVKVLHIEKSIYEFRRNYIYNNIKDALSKKSETGNIGTHYGDCRKLIGNS